MAQSEEIRKAKKAEYDRKYRAKNKEHIKKIKSAHSKTPEYKKHRNEKARANYKDDDTRIKILESAKKRRSTHIGKIQTRNTRLRQTEKFPEKMVARSAVGHALRDGKLFKEPCFYCGSTENIEAHHTDYSKPLDVTWMCLSHHRELHAIINRHFKH